MVNAKDWLEENYPKNGTCRIEKKIDWMRGAIPYENFGKRRSEIEILDITSQDLEGVLYLEEFINLKKLNCSGNLLECLYITKKNKDKLISVDITNNNFPEQNLTLFGDLVNLEVLKVGNYERNKKDVYNRFEGSLHHLKKLTHLKELDIRNTDIDLGLEYLPKSLEWLTTASYLGGKDWKVKRIEKILREYNKEQKFVTTIDNGSHDFNRGGCSYAVSFRAVNFNDKGASEKDQHYLYQVWRKKNLNLIKQIKENEAILNLVYIIGNKESKENLIHLLGVLAFHLEEELISARKELYQEQEYQTQIIQLPPRND